MGVSSQLILHSFSQCVHSSCGCLSRPGFPARPFCSAFTLTVGSSRSQDPLAEGPISLYLAHHVHHLPPPSHDCHIIKSFPALFGTEVNPMHVN